VGALHADITRLQSENARLRAEIESVKKSSYAIERIAREDLGMSKKGETVYMLPTSAPAATHTR
jgi:cell division protein FtsB